VRQRAFPLLKLQEGERSKKKVNLAMPMATATVMT
jgi:hypothetical protein